MRQREETIKIWTDMWLGNDTMPMDAIFTEDVVYTECWGNKYNGGKKSAAGLQTGTKTTAWLCGRFRNSSIRTIRLL